MTDPTGRSFLSYRRDQLEQALAITAAQRERGIPTWQDVTDLEEEPSEEYIAGVLEDPFTANGVVWISPDVEHSRFIREVELPRIQKRARASDAFFMVPCSAGGIGHDKASSISNSTFTLEEQRRWNMVEFTGAESSAQIGHEVARRVLRRRVKLIHKNLAPEEPFKVRIHTRTPPAIETGIALSLDWTHHFDGRKVHGDAWDSALLPALEDVATAIQEFAPKRVIEAEGLCSLSAALSLGRIFLEPAGLTSRWKQRCPGGNCEPWSLEAGCEHEGFEVTSSGHDLQSTHLAVLVSVSADVEAAVAQSARPEFRAIVRVNGTGAYPRQIAGAFEASNLARMIANAIRNAKCEFPGIREIHLFMAAPVGLSFLLGRLLNTLGPVTSYEHHQTDCIGCYEPCVTLRM